MNITIAALQVIMVRKQVASGYAILLVMSVLMIFSAVLLVWYSRRIKFSTPGTPSASGTDE